MTKLIGRNDDNIHVKKCRNEMKNCFGKEICNYQFIPTKSIGPYLKKHYFSNHENVKPVISFISSSKGTYGEVYHGCVAIIIKLAPKSNLFKINKI